MTFLEIGLLVLATGLGVGWVTTASRNRRAARARRDVVAAFAVRNDAAVSALAPHLGAGEENLWRRLTTARVALEEGARQDQQARRDLEDVLASLQDAVLVVDAEARLRFLNEAALRLFDVRIEDVLGAHLIEALPSFGIDAAMRTALHDGKASAHEVHLYSPRLREVFLRVAPVFSASGQETGAVAILQDLTELRRLERVRRDFVANASHELRTPVANIRAVAETIQNADHDPQIIARFLPPLVAEAERLSRLVADLLDLARADASEASAHEPVALREVVSSVVSSLHEKSQRRGIEIDWHPNGCAPMVAGDPAALEQVAFNLIDNALSYTPEGGRVELLLHTENSELDDSNSVNPANSQSNGEAKAASSASAESDGVNPAHFSATARGPLSSASGAASGVSNNASSVPSCVAVLEVRDSGIGIPEADLPRVFERFYRVDKARSRAEGGTGLGLAIVKHIVENHGGHVEVDSKVGQGTTFRVELPTLEA